MARATLGRSDLAENSLPFFNLLFSVSFIKVLCSEFRLEIARQVFRRLDTLSVDGSIRTDSIWQIAPHCLARAISVAKLKGVIRSVSKKIV